MKIAALLVFVALAGSVLWMRFSRGVDLGEDFTAFYLAGKLPPQSLYDQVALRAAGERWLAPHSVSYFPPYVRPAVFALPLRLLSMLPYRSASIVWLVLLYAAYIGTIAIVWKIFQPPIYVLAIFGVFYPGIIGPTLGQDATIEAAIVAGSLALLIANRDIAAGALMSCCLYKFNLVWLLPLVLLVHSRYRAVIAFCAGGAILAGASALLSSTSAYVTLLQNIPKYTNVPAGMTSGIRGILWGAGLEWLYLPLVAAAAVITFLTIKRLPIEPGFCIALIVSYVFAYKVAWYDAAVLIIPLIAALRRDSEATSIPALFLLLPVLWVLYERGTVFILLALCVGFALPAIIPVIESWSLKRVPDRALL